MCEQSSGPRKLNFVHTQTRLPGVCVEVCVVLRFEPACPGARGQPGHPRAGHAHVMEGNTSSLAVEFADAGLGVESRTPPPTAGYNTVFYDLRGAGRSQDSAEHGPASAKVARGHGIYLVPSFVEHEECDMLIAAAHECVCNMRRPYKAKLRLPISTIQHSRMNTAMSCARKRPEFTSATRPSPRGCRETVAGISQSPLDRTEAGI